MRKFLIVNPFGIGDVLFTTPVIRAINEGEAGSLIGYWCNERVKDILEDNPRIQRIFALSRGDLKKVFRKSIWRGIREFVGLIKDIKEEGFDIMLDFSLDHRYSLIAKISGIKRRIGFNYKNRGRFLTDKIDIDGYSNKHVVEYYLDLLKPAGIEPKGNKLELFIPDDARARNKNMFMECGVYGKGPLIGIAPGAGASWGKDAHLKHWPAGRFAELADRVIDRFKAAVVILGDEAERPIAGEIMNNMRNKPLDLVGKLSLKDLSAVIEGLDILVTNDGGPLHIAAALGKKTVSFFGPVDPKVYGPYPYDEKRHIVLKKGLECSPCYVKFHLSDCMKNKECLETIAVDSA
ncbi:MAG: glycosyltransferase family 9 protein, partial [Candidatus Omnitrophota bacterium]